MGKPSVSHQINRALKAVFTPGTSRHELKRRGVEDQRIVSHRTMEDYVSAGCRFARFCEQEFDIDWLRELTPEMADAYIGMLYRKGRSGGHIDREGAAIRKLDVALREKGWRDEGAPELLEPGVGYASDPHPEWAYDPDVAKIIIQDMRDSARNPQTAQAADLQRIAGLRISEAATLHGHDIDLNENRIHVEGTGGAKGGRDRDVAVDDEYTDFLAELKGQAAGHADGYVFQGRGKHGRGLADRTREAVRQACLRLDVEYYGTHGFRRMWAQETFWESHEEGTSRQEAGWKVAQALGHGRLEVLRHYLPSW